MALKAGLARECSRSLFGRRNKPGYGWSRDTGGRVCPGRPIGGGVLQVPTARVFDVQIHCLIDGYMEPITRAHNCLLLWVASSHALCAWCERMLTCLKQRCAWATDIIAVWYGYWIALIQHEKFTQPQIGLCKLQQQHQLGHRSLPHGSLRQKQTHSRLGVWMCCVVRCGHEIEA